MFFCLETREKRTTLAKSSWHSKQETILILYSKNLGFCLRKNQKKKILQCAGQVICSLSRNTKQMFLKCLKYWCFVVQKHSKIWTIVVSRQFLLFFLRKGQIYIVIYFAKIIFLVQKRKFVIICILLVFFCSNTEKLFSLLKIRQNSAFFLKLAKHCLLLYYLQYCCPKTTKNWLILLKNIEFLVFY